MNPFISHKISILLATNINGQYFDQIKFNHSPFTRFDGMMQPSDIQYTIPWKWGDYAMVGTTKPKSNRYSVNAQEMYEETWKGFEAWRNNREKKSTHIFIGTEHWTISFIWRFLFLLSFEHSKYSSNNNSYLYFFSISRFRCGSIISITNEKIIENHFFFVFCFFFFYCCRCCCLTANCYYYRAHFVVPRHFIHLNENVLYSFFSVFFDVTKFFFRCLLFFFLTPFSDLWLFSNNSVSYSIRRCGTITNEIWWEEVQQENSHWLLLTHSW